MQGVPLNLDGLLAELQSYASIIPPLAAEVAAANDTTAAESDSEGIVNVMSA